MTTVEQPHLVSLVLQSKKALQHGEQLCHGANDLSNATAQCAVDIFALDAKIKWITDAVVEQLKVLLSTHIAVELWLNGCGFYLAGSERSEEYRGKTVEAEQGSAGMVNRAFP